MPRHPLSLSAHRDLFIQDRNDFRQDLGRATRFDGSTQISTGAALTNITNSGEGTLHAWVRTPAAAAAVHTILENDAGKFSLTFTAGELFRIVGQRPADTTVVLDLQTGAAVDDGLWHHILASWDLAAPVADMYIDGVLNESVVTATVSETIDYEQPDWAIGAATDLSANLDGHIAELWFVDEHLDLSDINIRRQFITSSLTRVDLGPIGQRPLRSAGATAILPNIMQRGGIDVFRRNKGAGIDFITDGEGTLQQSGWPPIRVGV